jgi:hypothetical protein
MAIYCTGTLLSPMGDLSCAKDMSGIYAQCKAEDPDMNIPDFIFEHLLNLETVFEHFENDADEKDGDKPHRPFQNLQSMSQTLVIVSRPLQIEPSQTLFHQKLEKIYAPGADNFIRTAFLTEVFHPPSFC